MILQKRLQAPLLAFSMRDISARPSENQEQFVPEFPVKFQFA